MFDLRRYGFLMAIVLFGCIVSAAAIFEASQISTSSTATAINPLYTNGSLGSSATTAERLAEAADSGMKSDVAQIATAVEECYTVGRGSYLSCMSTSSLQAEGYIRSIPTNTVKITPIDSRVSNLVIYGKLQSSSAICQTGNGSNKYSVYRTSTGQTQIECTNTTPSLTASPSNDNKYSY